MECDRDQGAATLEEKNLSHLEEDFETFLRSKDDLLPISAEFLFHLTITLTIAVMTKTRTVFS